MDTLVDRIKRLAESQHMSLAELERKLDFSNGQIRRWMKATPGSDKIKAIAEYFDVSMDYLMGLESWEDMRVEQAMRDFDQADLLVNTRFRNAAKVVPSDKQDQFLDELVGYMDFLKAKYRRK